MSVFNLSLSSWTAKAFQPAFYAPQIVLKEAKIAAINDWIRHMGSLAHLQQHSANFTVRVNLSKVPNLEI